MEIQYLNGIDIQYLDGATANRINEARAAYARIRERANRDAAARRFVVRNLTEGITNETAQQAQLVAEGADLSGFSGMGTIADEERIRNYLVRTKYVVDNAPSMIGDYQKPEDLSQMIGYVLSKWDTSEREDALDYMAHSEQVLSGLGSINANVAGDRDDLTQETFSDVENFSATTQTQRRSISYCR